MTRKQRRKLAKVCNAKDLVCKTCVSQKSNVCKKCPIVNLVDNELHRINKTKGNDSDYVSVADEFEISFDGIK